MLYIFFHFEKIQYLFHPYLVYEEGQYTKIKRLWLFDLFEIKIW